MTRLALFLSFGLALSSLPSGLAGPACARQHYQAANCVSICQAKWGWTGMVMGTDPWGSVVKKMDATTSLDAVISQACGSSVVTTPAASSEYNSTGTASATPSAIPTRLTTGATSGARSITTRSSSSTHKSSSKAASQTTLGLLASAGPVSSAVTTPQPTTADFAPPVAAAENKPTVQNTPPAQNTPPPAQNTPAPASSSGSGSSSDSSSSDGATSSADITAYLLGHNSIRAIHGAQDLTWNNNLAAKAQQWANGCKFVHSGGTLGPFGENLAAGTGPSYTIPVAIKSWTDEVSQYNPSDPVASHFTQVVWKASTEVGCAVQTCSGIFPASFGAAQYFVCEYSIQGNVEGEFAQNVQV